MSFFGNLSSLFGNPPAKGAAKPGVVGKAPLAPKRPLGKLSAPQQPTEASAQAVQPQIKPLAPKAPADFNQPRPLKSFTLPQPVAQKPQVSEEVLTQQDVVREANSRAKEIIVEAKDEALAIRSKAEQDAREVRHALEDQQRSLDAKLDKIDSRLSQMDERERAVEKAKADVVKVKEDLEVVKQQQLENLEKTSGMTRDEAKVTLFENLEKKLAKEMAQHIRQKEEEARTQADEKVREILVDAMKHGATDYVTEYTVSTIKLGSEEDKGRIIGKAGRNIHTFEKVTGVDVDLDVSPTEVRLSCFDPVRREIARISLERLVKDGRIQPSRIEEIVKKVATELDKIMFEEGKKLCHAVGVYNMPTELIQMLGRFKYRFSYGQNLIAHTMEETQIGIKLAHELGANVNTVKLGCLLHDIGKVSQETEGSHVELGVKICKKYGIPQEVIDCVEQHHEDKPFSSVESMIVYTSDAISGARPGARYENYEEYVQRLQKLEEIATSYPEVEQAYAIQAGREVRVLLRPEKTKDDDVQVLAMKIRDRVKNEMTYPGTVTVTVARETRSQQVAG